MERLANQRAVLLWSERLHHRDTEAHRRLKIEGHDSRVPHPSPLLATVRFHGSPQNVPYAAFF